MQDNTQQNNSTSATPDPKDKKVIEAAHTEAEKDMEEDAEFTATSPNDDLDEEESARLSDENPL